MRLFLPLALLTFLISCNSTKSGNVTSSGAINAEAPYLWLTPNFPKTLSVSTVFGTDAAKVEAIGNAWSTALENKVDFFNYTMNAPEKTVGLMSPNDLDDDIFGVYVAQVWPYPDYPDALAVTQIFAFRHNRGRADEFVAIQEADIIMNYERFEFDNPSSTSDYDLKTVMLHEMGHFLGLGHKSRTSNRSSSVMYPSIFSSEVKQIPRPIDISDMAAKYKITLSGGASPANLGELPVYQPHDAGTAVKIILELRPSGECVHHEDGVEIRRHLVKLK